MERRLALLSALLFLTLIYTRLPNATHHYFSVLVVMGATAVLMPEASLRRLAIAGALLGVASFFTQTHGLAALLAFRLLMCWEQYSTDDFWEKFWRKERILLLAFILVLLILSAPFIAGVGLKQIWYCQVTYVRKVMVHAPETHLYRDTRIFELARAATSLRNGRIQPTFVCIRDASDDLPAGTDAM